MHIFFSGIGGTGIGPLALIAKQAGYTVSGSDKQESGYVDYLRTHGITDISIGQSRDYISNNHKENPIDWVVYSSAVLKENPDNHPEITFAEVNGIRHSKRDEFLSELLELKHKKLIAIAGTHGKTTTTAMTIWMFKQLGLPISYSVGAKISFGEMGEFNEDSEYFVYEADEYDRNFLSFYPDIAIIPGIAYDHPDIYPSQEEYTQAFKQFLDQSQNVTAHFEDLDLFEVPHDTKLYDKCTKLVDRSLFTLDGEVNRANAQLVVSAVQTISSVPLTELVTMMNHFPGVSRRFEMISANIYSDYAHTPEKIRGALQLAHEVAGENVVVVYEGLHNTRQHFIKKELVELFSGIKKLYIVPSYLAREDESLEMLTPEKLYDITQQPAEREPVKLDDSLKISIASHAKNGDLVLCLSAGGGGSLDEWLRAEFKQ
jgi:UDP-N-acetylmuramate--alanine ligase